MNKTHKQFLSTKLSASIALISSSMMLSPVIMAEEAQAEAKSDELEIGGILVTAQKRVQSLQDVAVTITTVGEEELANAGVNSIQDIKTVWRLSPTGHLSLMLQQEINA